MIIQDELWLPDDELYLQKMLILLLNEIHQQLLDLIGEEVLLK